MVARLFHLWILNQTRTALLCDLHTFIFNFFNNLDHGSLFRPWDELTYILRSVQLVRTTSEKIFKKWCSAHVGFFTALRPDKNSWTATQYIHTYMNAYSYMYSYMWTRIFIHVNFLYGINARQEELNSYLMHTWMHTYIIHTYTSIYYYIHVLVYLF